jgi:hypothetical protein
LEASWNTILTILDTYSFSARVASTYGGFRNGAPEAPLKPHRIAASPKTSGWHQTKFRRAFKQACSSAGTTGKPAVERVLDRLSMNKLEEISAGKKEAPAAGEGATPEGSGEVAAAEAKAADTREAVAAKIDVDTPLSGSTATASQIAAPEGLPPLASSVPPRFPLHPAVNDEAAAGLACADQRSRSSAPPELWYPQSAKPI